MRTITEMTSNNICSLVGKCIVVLADYVILSITLCIGNSQLSESHCRLVIKCIVANYFMLLVTLYFVGIAR